MNPTQFHRFGFSFDQLAKVDHFVNHVTSQTRRDYVSFRGKNKICLIPKYPCQKDIGKHVASLEVIIEDWKDDILPFKSEIREMRHQLNSLLTYDDEMGAKITLLRNQMIPHLRRLDRLDEIGVTGEYKTNLFFSHFSFSFVFPTKSQKRCLLLNDFVATLTLSKGNWQQNHKFSRRYSFRIVISIKTTGSVFDLTNHFVLFLKIIWRFPTHLF